MKHYPAPWSATLIVVSSLTTAICVAVSLGIFWGGRGAAAWFALVPLAVILGAAPFAIRGYSISTDAVLVHRLWWTTRLPLAGLQSAQFDPNAMRGSIRTCGNGGLFSFTGFYRNRQLGAYRAFVTDLHRTVVLRYPESTVVVSPAAPEDFVHELGIAGRAL